MEEHHLIYARKLKEDQRLFMAEKEWAIHGMEMEYEDMCSYADRLHQWNETHKEQLFVAKQSWAIEKEKRTHFEYSINEVTQNLVDLTERYGEVCQEL